jgi:subtilisin family serine protease
VKKLFLLLVLVLFAHSNIFSQAEVSSRLQQQLNESDANNYLKVLIYLQDQVDVEVLDAQLYLEKALPETRAYKVITALQEKAASTQGPLINYLEEKLVDRSVFSYKTFWVANFILIEAKPSVINEIKLRQDVSQMDIDALLDYDKPTERGKITTESIMASEPGLKIVNADKLWQIGITGQGRLLMGSDTGVRHTHVALNARWRGNFVPPSQAWYDPGGGTTTPSDCDGHGTHTVGTMVGRSPAGDTVGLAIDAHWIAAKTICTSPSTSNCIAGFQWALNPDGNPSTTSDMPDAIGNSWYDPDAASTQCTGIYKTTLEALEAAGIAVVFSAGNNGPGTSTITPPKNINTDETNVFSVANIQGALWLAGNTDPISSSSSRGPSTCGGTGSLLIKPEVSAPGTSVRSCYGSGDNTYSSLTGTSMACPHIVGAIGLLKQAYPNLTGKQVKLALYNTARDLGVAGEDNTYGKGLIDVYAAYQYLAALLLPLNPFNINTPLAGVTVTSFPNSSSSAQVTWDTASAGATYKWIFGNAGNPRMLVLNSNTNVLNINLGVLDNLLAGMGLLPGDSVVGEWDVWAYRNNPPTFDSLKSTNGPRAITLKRGIPQLVPFSLSNPPNGSRVVTSVFNNSPVVINWRKSGDGVKYKWKFGTNVVTNPILELPSGNLGYDTSLTVINSGLDLILGGLGLAPGDSIVGQWAVWAYSGLDSLKSTETFGITFKRQAKGDYLIAYDSTSTACRASKDSVSLYLGSQSLTFDLFNRGTQSSTNVISFRGYKTLIWLGEGTSVMSVVQKDSVKAYLNNPPAGQKSNLIIFAEDIGYQFGRSASTYYDLAFMNNYLGANYVLDRPSSGANQGLIGVYLNPGTADSTVGSWPDVLSRFDTATTHNLYKFRSDNSINAIGKVGATYNVTTFGVDIESLRRTTDSPAGSPYARLLSGGILYVNTNGTLVPVELTSFTVVANGNNVLLNWSTATELNNRGFEVERKSLAGNFVSIGFVQGKGTTTEVQNYVFGDAGLPVGKYIYRLKQIDFDGTSEYSSSIEVEVGLPAKFSLEQNYPNPFNPSTTINFSLAVDAAVSLKIFDILGQEVHSFINNEMKAGYHNYVFDASSLSSGIYFYQINAKGNNGIKFTNTKKMILTK